MSTVKYQSLVKRLDRIARILALLKSLDRCYYGSQIETILDQLHDETVASNVKQ